MNRNKDHAVTALIMICALAIIACAAYLLYNYVYLPRAISARNEGYAALYSPAAAPNEEIPSFSGENIPADVPSQLPKTTPFTSAAPLPSDQASLQPDKNGPAADLPAETPIPSDTPAPSESPAPSEAPAFSEAPASSESPASSVESAADAASSPEEHSAESDLTDILLGTPGPDTMIYASPTLPPVQGSFADLMAFNPETVGFLRLRDIALPVVQRENDNSFYLDHDFEGNESSAGSLFLDGVNRLHPSDICLFIYGHNMKNGAMFGDLTDFAGASVIRENPIVRFDTIYRDGEYVPFACFELTADRNASNFFNLRTFAFTEESFAEYTAELKKRSFVDIPVDVRPGDELLLLITCDYSINDGRFVLACRRLREGETESSVRALVGQATQK